MDRFQGRIMNADMAVSLPKKGLISYVLSYVLLTEVTTVVLYMQLQKLSQTVCAALVIYCWDQNVPGFLYLGLNKSNPRVY